MPIALSIDDYDIAARTLYGEARGESDEGQQAVALVIITRAKLGGWWGRSIKDVCYKAWQFSCWNENDPNRAKMRALSIEDPEYLRALQNFMAAMRTKTDFAPTHYHTKSISPSWAETMPRLKEIGNHIFYKER